MGIKLENLVVKFGDFKAINDVTLQIPKGKLVSLLGPSGSGKSTTLFTISGIHKPHSGKIFFGDRDVTGLDPEKLGIGLVFQNYALYPHMTVRENIMFPLKNLKWDKAKAEARVLEVAKIVKIQDQLDKKPAQLSGGQQQRVAIARAIAKNPDILLLDEPLSNLDTKLRVETRQEIRRIQKETGVTAIFVTHDQEEAMSISDEIVLMKDGAIQQISSPSDIYMNPCNKFVASFIGSPEMNFIDLTINNGECTIDTLKIDNLPKDMSKGTLGVRAEDFEVATEGLKTKVMTVEILGRERLLTLEHNDRTYKMLVDKEFYINEGEELIVRPKTGKSYVFDAESEAFVTKC
ncbi:ABC transporter ATP-binding protein [Clostridium sp. NSJ-49]|uniref:Carbohydrate uptake ABC transporter ATP-binding protein n=1 Tax=Clostridium disporicum TaxID=84024 RepID=A0A173XYN7_9CLOT|nr:MULTISPECIES: ABC transporter ATP-binding protein [Clostridium]MBC5625613.1 ABC transporter ATP-binding protein [Clostridium sp. NSJ-49]MDU6339765.1 ABC transporter ATP-binding protein [Clostridium sp.]CUN56390.1 carbohydrate uptake ABC transporter ATP-binding protein [Clostridium disporicum]